MTEALRLVGVVIAVCLSWVLLSCAKDSPCPAAMKLNDKYFCFSDFYSREDFIKRHQDILCDSKYEGCHGGADTSNADVGMKCTCINGTGTCVSEAGPMCGLGLSGTCTGKCEWR